MEEKTTNIKLEPQPISEVEIDSNHLATIMYKNNLAILYKSCIEKPGEEWYYEYKSVAEIAPSGCNKI